MVVEQLKPKDFFSCFSLSCVRRMCVLILSLTEENIAERADELLFSLFSWWVEGMKGFTVK